MTSSPGDSIFGAVLKGNKQKETTLFAAWKDCSGRCNPVHSALRTVDRAKRQSLKSCIVLVFRQSQALLNLIFSPEMPPPPLYHGVCVSLLCLTCINFMSNPQFSLSAHPAQGHGILESIPACNGWEGFRACRPPVYDRSLCVCVFDCACVFVYLSRVFTVPFQSWAMAQSEIRM